MVLEVKYRSKTDPKSIQSLSENDMENKIGFRISFWIDFGCLWEQNGAKYLIDFELIFDRLSGWGCAKGSDGSPPPGVFFRFGAPLESRFGRARTANILESNQEYTISTQ